MRRRPLCPIDHSMNSTPRTFSQAAWQRNLALYQDTLALPFNQELAAGTLSTGRFPTSSRTRTTWWPTGAHWPSPAPRPTTPTG